uniref:Uncharacterized protein n=1 Tax=Lepeophtheirus salmonis TaxID=72036 RepID=A0A0K2V0U3_LEPSM
MKGFMIPIHVASILKDHMFSYLPRFEIIKSFNTYVLHCYFLGVVYDSLIPYFYATMLIICIV